MPQLFRTTAFTLLLIWVSCQSKQQRHFLQGHWSAFRYERADSSVLQDYLNQVTLSIDGNNRYSFTSTLNYREAGTFRLSDQFFFVTDTTRLPSREKKLLIRYLTKDTLILGMEEDGEDRTLMMYRSNTDSILHE